MAGQKLEAGYAVVEIALRLPTRPTILERKAPGDGSSRLSGDPGVWEKKPSRPRLKTFGHKNVSPCKRFGVMWMGRPGLETYAGYTRCQHCGIYDSDPHWCDLCGVRKEIQRIVDQKRAGRRRQRAEQSCYGAQAGETLVAGRAVAITRAARVMSSTLEEDMPLDRDYGRRR
jgi:hypothetical protein